MKNISKYNFIIISIIILAGSIIFVNIVIAGCAITTTTTTTPVMTTTTVGSSGNCLCVESNGAYTCWDTINNECCSSCGTCPPQWACSEVPLGCYESTSGYFWKDNCEDNCHFGYNCYPGFVCSYAFLGQYSTLSGCEACCSESGCNATTYYSCNPDPDNPRCVVDSGGSYTSWAYCEDNCGASNGGGGTTTTTIDGGGTTTTTTMGSTTTTTILPEPQPCMINYFELPERAWVGYPITGKWSASDWCDDCDVDCTPYIGTGFDEYKFTLEQSGTYNYTLTCYGEGGIDERTESATVEALNLPWWREIIPVLPGFLRGIFR